MSQSNESIGTALLDQLEQIQSESSRINKKLSHLIDEIVLIEKMHCSVNKMIEHLFKLTSMQDFFNRFDDRRKHSEGENHKRLILNDENAAIVDVNSLIDRLSENEVNNLTDNELNQYIDLLYDQIIVDDQTIAIKFENLIAEVFEDDAEDDVSGFDIIHENDLTKDDNHNGICLQIPTDEDDYDDNASMVTAKESRFVSSSDDDCCFLSPEIQPESRSTNRFLLKRSIKIDHDDEDLDLMIRFPATKETILPFETEQSNQIEESIDAKAFADVIDESGLEPTPKSLSSSSLRIVSSRKNSIKKLIFDQSNYDETLDCHQSDSISSKQKSRSPSLDSSIIGERNYDWRTVRNLWERRSLGPHHSSIRSKNFPNNLTIRIAQE
ncbi:hypothetical protein SSS_08597 [Sarcoptes scabiei]|uniref:Uncharacterized protein n=1 Tax=Sarcoptes scabiei TaxID=52283 RepID=A0A132AFX4_SARSC|nr:hypothetical protein SSS_08597 [Sarcoptes scabiei]KPM09833.1 hypothetical protein QR98_0083780 [Sarcoptes scabiei]